MREIRPSGSEGGAAQINAPSLPLSMESGRRVGFSPVGQTTIRLSALPRQGRGVVKAKRGYFLKPRTSLTSALMSASVSPSAGFITCLSSFLTPSLMALVASASVKDACTLASV